MFKRRMRVAIGKSIFVLVAKHLPVSFSPVKIGQKKLRAFCGKLILDKCGKDINIERNSVFSSKIQLGDRSGIGINASISGTCIIGNDVMMGPDCVIYSKNHAFARTDITMHEQGFQEEKPVYIGNDVWIGGRVMIMPGVHIGNGCIIAAGAVVTKDIPDWSVAGGVPARVIKKRKE